MYTCLNTNEAYAHAENCLYGDICMKSSLFTPCLSLIWNYLRYRILRILTFWNPDKQMSNWPVFSGKTGKLMIQFPHKPRVKKRSLHEKQAGAELCQAQEKLGLVYCGCLPFTLKLRSSSIYLKIEVVFQLPKNWGRLPFT